jgi:signal transduction histidine kinase
MLGHDLRTPLGALAGSLDVLGQPNLTDEQKLRTAQIGKRSVASISHMITDLLEYTRSRLGRGIEVVPRAGDLGDVCQYAVDEMRIAYPSRAFDGETSGDLSANFDAGRMRQMLVNLLVNAVQHGEPGTPVTLDVRAAGPSVRLAVRNLGKPIPAESLQVIFNPLVQITAAEGESPEQRPASSLGLGLYIAREIVTGHGGTIHVTSTEADGTSFIVEIPRG